MCGTTKVVGNSKVAKYIAPFCIHFTQHFAKREDLPSPKTPHPDIFTSQTPLPQVQKWWLCPCTLIDCFIQHFIAESNFWLSDGKHLVAGDEAGTVHVFQILNSGKQLKLCHHCKGHQGSIKSLDWSSDGKFVRSSSLLGEYYVCELIEHLLQSLF